MTRQEAERIIRARYEESFLSIILDYYEWDELEEFQDEEGKNWDDFCELIEEKLDGIEIQFNWKKDV